LTGGHALALDVHGLQVGPAGFDRDKVFHFLQARSAPNGEARRAAHSALHLDHHGVAGGIGDKLHLVAVFKHEVAQFLEGQVGAVGRTAARARKGNVRGAVLRFCKFYQGRPRGLALGKFKFGRGAHRADGGNRGPLVADHKRVALLHAHGWQNALACKGVQIKVGYSLAVAHKADIAVTAARRIKPARLVQKAQQGVAGRAGVAPWPGHAAGNKDGDGPRIQRGRVYLHVGVSVGGQLAAQGFGQFVVAKTGHGNGPHFGHVQMPVGRYGQGAVNLEVATPKAQHHAVAWSDDGGVLGVLGRVLALRKVALKQVGCIGLRSVFGSGRAGQDQKNQQKSK